MTYILVFSAKEEGMEGGRKFNKLPFILAIRSYHTLHSLPSLPSPGLPPTVQQDRPQDDVDALESVSDTQSRLGQLHLEHQYDVVQEVDREVCTHVQCCGGGGEVLK